MKTGRSSNLLQSTASRLISTIVGLTLIGAGILIATVGVGNFLVFSTLPFIGGGWLIWKGGIEGSFVISKGPLLFGLILIIPIVACVAYVMITAPR